MRRFRTGRFKNRRGAASVELALMLPLLLTLFVAIGDFGRIFHYSVIISNCARNGALFESDPSIADASPYATLEQAALADATDLTPQPTVKSVVGLHSSGLQYVDVTVTYPFQMLTSLPGVPRTINITRHVRMIKRPSEISVTP